MRKNLKKLGVKVVAIFREEKEGLAGLEKVRASTGVPFTLALDTPASATAGYSNGMKEFDNYVVDNTGVIRGVIDGSIKNRAPAAKFVEIVKSIEGGSAGMAAATPADDQAAVQQAVLSYVDGMHQANTDLIKQVVHPDVKMFGLAGASMGKVMQKDFTQIMNSAANHAANHKAMEQKVKVAPKVKVLDVTGDLASAKLTSPRGAAMMQLIKEGGKWKILQILSQMNSK